MRPARCWSPRRPRRPRGSGPRPPSAALTCRPPAASGAVTSRRRILPVGPLGSSSTIQTDRGYLYAARRSFANACSSSSSTLLAVLERDGGADLLAQVVVLDADHGDLGDGVVLVERLLDLARVDVVAAADDQVLLAVDDEEVAVLVLLGHVAGEEPAVGDGLLGLLLLAPVALHHVLAPDRDLADLALLDVLAVVVDQLHLDAAHRHADRARLALDVGLVERGDRRGLGEPVALEHDAVEGLLELLHHLDRHRRAARDAGAQAGDVVGLRRPRRAASRRTSSGRPRRR